MDTKSKTQYTWLSCPKCGNLWLFNTDDEKYTSRKWACPSCRCELIVWYEKNKEVT